MNILTQAKVMSFLNEIADDFPSSISLAAGRPTERFFENLNADALMTAYTKYVRHAARGRNLSEVSSKLLQYGRTAGVLGDLIVGQLLKDEGIRAAASQVLVTSGCQEALALCLPTLCPEKSDVVLVCNPTYAGATGIASLSGVSVFPLQDGHNDIIQSMHQAMHALSGEQRQARVLYLIPNFDNPTGQVLHETQRIALLELCARARIVVLEDNPYGMFRYEGQAFQSMAALDKAGCVIYLTTFSKTLSPALRVGAAIVPRTLFGSKVASQELWNTLVQRKSFLTINTSQITQALVGGLLLQENGTLQNWIEPALGWYKQNRNAMLASLEECLGPLSESVHWNKPEGGFFLSLSLPFTFDTDAVVECATDYGVIVMPMSFFALDESQDHKIRLAFSATTPDEIHMGILSLAKYIVHRMDLSGSTSCNQKLETRHRHRQRL